MFSKSKKACTNYLTKLTQFRNSKFFVQAFFYLDARSINIYVPGDCIFLFKMCKCVHKNKKNKKIPIVIGALGTILKRIHQCIKQIDISLDIISIQKTALEHCLYPTISARQL